MKRVLITSVGENGCDRHYCMGDVTEDEFLQLKTLIGSTVYDRQDKVLICPVLRRVYTYHQDGDDFYEVQDEVTDAVFAKVDAEEVADLACHHIVWESCA